jgi:hypothetical protein
MDKIQGISTQGTTVMRATMQLTMMSGMRAKGPRFGFGMAGGQTRDQTKRTSARLPPYLAGAGAGGGERSKCRSDESISSPVKPRAVAESPKMSSEDKILLLVIMIILCTS